MRTSADIQTIESWQVPRSVDRLLESNRQNLIGKFVGDKYLSEDKLWESLVTGTMNRATQQNAAMETLEDSSGQPIGIVFGETATWDSEHFRKRLGKVTLLAFENLA